MQYFVTLKYPGRRAISHHEFPSFEEAMKFSVPNVERFNVSITHGEEEGPREEVVLFRRIR